MKDKRNRHGAVGKLSSEQHFCNPLPLVPLSCLLCEISGPLHLAQPGLTAGWLAGRRNTGEFRNFQSWL